jgi:hypothetical protein
MRSLDVLTACQSLILFSIVHYPGILFTGSKSICIGDQRYLIEEGMVSDIIHVCDLSIDFQFGNLFYCFAFIMVQREFLVLEALAYDERISQLDRDNIL